MGEFVITCCSTADMDRKFFEDRGIPFACFHCLMDGKEYQDDLGKSMAPEEFYRRVAAGAMPTTAQINVEEYEELFRPVLEEGKDVLHITLSSGISGSINSARLAKEQLEEEFPERKILVEDSLGASSGYGMLVMLADDMRQKGAGLEETAAWVRERRPVRHGPRDLPADECGRRGETGSQGEVPGEEKSDPGHGGEDEAARQRWEKL